MLKETPLLGNTVDVNVNITPQYYGRWEQRHNTGSNALTPIVVVNGDGD